ncbi:hypothetical protein WKK05_00190 [Nostoc sp. UHCC 0302]|uniref:hypothetical protein n=1 Tax=Nostoc sp. UHCC 0302 TaxID=3134896 RepID=UPI00311CAE44
MKSIIKPSLKINSDSKLPIGLVLTFALANLLSFGLGFATNQVAEAVPGAEQIQLSQNLQNRRNLPRAVARRVLRDASKRSGVRISDLKITQFASKTFGNPCEFNFGEICTREYNPVEGWEVIVEVKEQSWTYHVNKSGSQIVLDPKARI